MSQIYSKTTTKILFSDIECLPIELNIHLKMYLRVGVITLPQVFQLSIKNNNFFNTVPKHEG